MATMAATPVTVTLSPEHASALTELIQDGRFASPDEAVAHSIDMLIEEAYFDTTSPAMEALICARLEQARRGDVVDGEVAMAKLNRLVQRSESR